jgi:hypothetical protein
MPSDVAFRLRSLLALSGALIALLAMALVTPTLATASPTKPVSVPDCFHFSVHKMAQLLHESSLKFDGGTFNPGESTCTWFSPRVPGRYRTELQVAVTAIDLAQFKQFARIAKHDAAQTGAGFTNDRFRGAARAFWVDQTFSSTHLAPCMPDQNGLPPPLPAFGPPACDPQPNSVKISADSYGALKPRGPKAFVAVAFDGERSLAYPGPEIALNEAILSGHIR